MRSSSLKTRVLLPFTVALVILLAALIFNVYHDQYDRLSEDVETRLEFVQELFDKQILSETEQLDAIIALLSKNRLIQEAWLAKDREALLQLSAPLLNDLSSKLRFTHFYFHDASRVNFLRVYNPERFGDRIDRYTIKQAEKTGKPAAGIELGKLGTLTLRMVHPWKINGKLVGYIEMGEEIDHLIRKLRDVLQVELYVSIYKEFINREDWEAGMKLMDLQSNWDQFPDSVIVGKTNTVIPEMLGSFLSRGQHGYMEMATGLKLSMGLDQFRVGVIPLFDASTQEVGDIVVLYNVTDLARSTKDTIIITSIICITIGLSLFVLFFKILDKVDNELTKHRQNLEELVYDRTDELMAANKHLNQEIVERRKAETALQEARDKLENMVEERTAQLAGTYEQLQLEANEKKQLVEQAAVAEERGRLARDLHDSMTQSLYSVSLFAQTAKELIETGDMDNLKLCLSELSAAAQGVHKELRLLVYNLRPLVLEEEGLVGALRQRLDTVENRAGLKTRLQIEGEIKLSGEVEEALYRVVQEVLNNILQHAAATEVKVTIHCEDQQTHLDVTDNGIGFDINDTSLRRGLGLNIMQERVEKIGGQLTIAASSGKGTTVSVRINNT